MLQAFIITLREGLEAFLIIAISLAYLRKSGRHALVPAIHWGVAVSIVVSIAAGMLLQRVSNQALWEGVLAIVAAVLVASLTVHMWRVAKRMKREIEGRLHASAIRAGFAAFLGVFGFTVLMITREGMETALLINALLFQVQSLQLVVGAMAGLLCAAGVAWLWSRYGHRVNLAYFFQVTAIFLLKRFSDSPCTAWARRGTSACTNAGGPMQAYSMDLRERALLDSDAGMKAADVAVKYRVSGSWVRLLKQRRRETGEVAPRVQRHGRRRMLEPHLHTLAALIAEQPDRTLAELKDALGTPARLATIWRAVAALDVTVKKNGPALRTRST